MSLLTPVRESLKTRVALFSFLGIAITFMIAGSLLTWSFRQSAQHALDNYLLAFMSSLIAATSVDRNGTVTIEAAGSGLEHLTQYWQISTKDNYLKKSPQLQAWVKAPPTTQGNVVQFDFVDRDHTEVYAVRKTIRFPGNVPVTYLIGTQKDSAEDFLSEQEQQFLVSLIVILTVLSLVLIVLSLVQIRLIATPFHHLHTSVSNLKDGLISQLPETLPKEIQPLVHELNTLLSYNAHMLERYRTFSSNLSHALKTPLAILKNEARNSKEKLGQTVLEKTKDMDALISRYLSRVRVGGTTSILMVRTPLVPVIRKIGRSFGKLYEKEIIICGDDAIALRIDETDVYELLGNLIENACKYGNDRIEVSASRDDSHYVIEIHDDGPGIEPSLRAEVLKRGVRLDETQDGTGIGIPIAMDIVTLYNGSLTLSESYLGGLQVIITLPNS